MVTEEYLLQVGVSHQHLERMSKEMNHGHAHYIYFYEEVSKEEAVVPVSEIRGLLGTRGFDGFSWLDHITGRAGTFTRLDNFKPWLEEQGLDAFRKSFTNPKYRVELGYYDQDEAYYVDGEGNHRTTWAKVLDVPFIAAKVTRYRLLPTHYRNYEKLQARRDELKQTIREYGLTMKKKSIGQKGAHISFKGHGSIRYHVYPKVYDYGNTDQVIAALRQYEKTLDFLHQVRELHERMGFIQQPKFRDFLLRIGKGLSNDREKKRIYESLLALYRQGWPEQMKEDQSQIKG